MEFRLASAGDLPQVMGLWDYCFEKKEDPFFQWYFREYCLQHNKVVGGFDEEGRLRNMLHLNPYQVLLRGAWQRCLISSAWRQTRRRGGTI